MDNKKYKPCEDCGELIRYSDENVKLCEFCKRKRRLKSRKCKEGSEIVEKKCDICGKVYLPLKHQQKYCSVECQKEAQRRRGKAYREKKGKEGEKANKLKMSLAEKNDIARIYGISYGQMEARLHKANLTWEDHKKLNLTAIVKNKDKPSI